MANEKWKFNLRSFTGFTLIISTIVMSWSGFILMLFTKSEWQYLHTIFSYLFFILVIIHLFFVNWKAFLTYFKSKVKAGINRKWELGASITLTTFFFIGTLLHWTPFEPVMTFGEKVKASWEGDFKAPPVLHMEIYTIEKLALEMDSIAPEKLIKALQENNIKVNGTQQTLKEVANENNTTPAAIYDIMTSLTNVQPKPASGEIPQGIGKYTVKSTAESSGKPIADLVDILKKNGIEADGNTSLRTIADQLGITPREVYSILTGIKTESGSH
jgi:hypothetical protein